MPVRRVPGNDTEYLLISYDAEGRERAEADGSMLSREAMRQVADSTLGITDVFFTSHGWKGDVKAAIEQYDKWIAAMLFLDADRNYARKRRPGFKPLIIGLHWPSLPWGDEDLPPETPDAALEREVNAYAHRIADTPNARDAIRSILTNASDSGNVDTLSADAKAAYDTLFRESGLGAGEVGAAPGADQDGFDPQRIIDEEKADEAEDAKRATKGTARGGFFGSIKEHLLSPLRQASFWAMKKRAHVFGESGGHELLAGLQGASPAARFHLMGHSFGCIVVSATIAGGKESTPLPRPVDSLFLVQGALSLWAFAPDIPYATGTSGYFHDIVKNGLVSGPIVTTRSKHDKAVGRYYPRGAKLKRQLVLVDSEYPKYGGIGSFGIQGVPAAIEELPIKPPTSPYGFKRGHIYNVEASRVISGGGGASGAHSDIARPEVAHIFWEAALAGL